MIKTDIITYLNGIFHSDSLSVILFDLNLYNLTTNGIKKQFNLVTRFPQDIDMNFGLDKCVHLITEKGQIKHNGQHLEMNGVKIQHVNEGECYKFLGQDGNMVYIENMIEKVLNTSIRKTIWNTVGTLVQKLKCLFKQIYITTLLTYLLTD